MVELVIVRHGQSIWNMENRFTGWWDIGLTELGVEEARVAGQALAQANACFDICFTSVQTRAIRTLNLMLEEMDQLWLPVVKDWRFNERHYGGLTGLNKADTAAKHGEAQVHLWRRSFDVPPPPQEPGAVYDVSGDRRYAGIRVPQVETLKDTIGRVLPAWEQLVVPELRAGKKVLIVAHGNSLRSLVKHLSGISDADIADFEIPTGKPILYTLDGDLRAVDRSYVEGV